MSTKSIAKISDYKSKYQNPAFCQKTRQIKIVEYINDNPIVFQHKIRHILQLHHDDGCLFRGANCCCAQLSPSNSGDTRYANMGKSL
jgi:hypothetical protein